jgi:hypothetical protein
VPKSVRVFRRSARLAFLSVVSISISSCGLWPDTEPRIETRTVTFDVTPELNQDYPLAFDIVFVDDVEVRAIVAGLSADAWFDQRAQLLRDHPTTLSNRTYEIVPGQQLPSIRLNGEERDAIGAFIFADFIANGTHRARLDSFERPVVLLGDRYLEILEKR